MKKTMTGAPASDDGHEEGGTPLPATEVGEAKAKAEGPLRDASAAMKVDPAARLHLPLLAPGPREMLEGKGAPGGGLISWSAGEPTLEVTRGNRRWLLLLLGVYLKFLQQKAPPLRAHQSDSEDIEAIITLLEPEQANDDFTNSDILLSFSQLFALREAVMCGLWIARDWLPACEERRNLLLPLESLRQDVERVLDEAIAAREAPEEERLLLMN